VTVTFTVPAEWAGVSAVSFVLETRVTDDAALVPNWTVAPDTKLVPVSVTFCPPFVSPAVGLIDFRVGGAS
jgi:hypothetical protein